MVWWVSNVPQTTSAERPSHHLQVSQQVYSWLLWVQNCTMQQWYRVACDLEQPVIWRPCKWIECLPAIRGPLRGFVRAIPISVMPYLSSSVWPVISCQRCIIGAGRAADPLTNSLQCTVTATDYSKQRTLVEFMFWLEKRLTLFWSIFLNLNVTKYRVGLNSQLENYLSAYQWSEKWSENFLSLEIK